MIYKNGEIYEGMWKDGRRHGPGRLVNDSKIIYQGEWYYDSQSCREKN
jgi:hypothetical protein